MDKKKTLNNLKSRTKDPQQQILSKLFELFIKQTSVNDYLGQQIITK